jgi:hypothetical protein
MVNLVCLGFLSPLHANQKKNSADQEIALKGGDCQAKANINIARRMSRGRAQKNKIFLVDQESENIRSFFEVSYIVYVTLFTPAVWSCWYIFSLYLY